MSARIAAFGLLVIAAAFGSAALAADTTNSAPAMIVPGHPGAAPSGAFTYSIPIAVAPGTAGMKPELSLEYSSYGGDGPVGYGWSLNGIPMITRCPRTRAQDSDVHGSVNYDANDRFCIDGQRLVLLNPSDTYGANGVEYRTENEAFSKVVSFGTAGNGPRSFEVHTKSGQIIEFGDTDNSRVIAQGIATARAWAVSKISDTAGNYMSFYYNDVNSPERQNGGEVYPIRIEYTGHSGSPTVAPYNSVHFLYVNRSDTTPAYQAGSIIKSTKLLSEIEVHNSPDASGVLVTQYLLHYNEDGTEPATARRRLTSVTQCAAGTNCLPPTTFAWQGSHGQITRQTQAISTAQGTADNPRVVAPGDFDGDGITDAVIPPLDPDAPANCGIYLGGSGSTVAFTKSTIKAHYQKWEHPEGSDWFSHWVTVDPCEDVDIDKIQAPDFNADGYSDLTFSQRVPDYIPGYVALINNTAGLLDQTSAYKAGGVYADFNGDGRTDLFAKGNGETDYHVYISNGSTLTATATFDGADTYSTADFNGDGCADLLRQGSQNKIYVGQSGCEPHDATIDLPDPWTGQLLIYGDWNGDGNADILALPVNTSTNGKLYLSTGKSLVLSPNGSGGSITGSSDWWKYQIVVGDWNGDGKTDIALVVAGFDGGYAAPQGHRIYLSTGTDFVLSDTIANPVSDNNTKVTAVAADWNNDGATDLWFKQPGGDKIYSFGYAADLVIRTSNGIGASNNVTYQRLSKPGVYTRGPNSTYPTRVLNGPLNVVARIDSDNGLGSCTASGGANCFSSTYKYVGAKADLKGRGFLGFASVSVKDEQSGVVQTTTYYQDFPLTGLVHTQTRVAGSVTINDVTNSYTTITYPNTTRRLVELSHTTVDSADLDGSVMPRVSTDYDSYDAWGNPTQITVNTAVGGGSKVTVNEYTNDQTHWILGRLTSTTVTYTLGSQDPVVRRASFHYDPTTGILDEERVEPLDPVFRLITNYTIDAFGNKTIVAVNGQGIAPRSTTSGYDAIGQFRTSITNALSQQETWDYYPKFGLPKKQTGPNGLSTSWTYDAFGRKTQELRPDGTTTNVEYLLCTAVSGAWACPARAAFMMRLTMLAANGTTHIGPVTATYFDSLSRQIAITTEGFDGKLTRIDTEFDGSGRVRRTNRPYFLVGGDATLWTTFDYDALGRTVTVTGPDNGQTTTAYHGLSTTVTNPKSQTTTSVTNSRGLTESVTDNLGKTVTYAYDPADNLRLITDPAGNITRNTYDVRGRKVETRDPDKGTWTYSHDVLGELTSQTDAKSQIVTFQYDLLGRMTKRIEPGLTSNWTYDTAANGIGQLAQATTSAGYVRAVTYDGKSRIKKVTLTIGGADYAYTTGYDANTGKAVTLSYPSGLVVRHHHNQFGYLDRINDDGTGQLLWQANTRDAELHTLNATNGAGVVTRQTFDPLTGLVQTIKAGVGGGSGVADMGFGFDKLGNLTSRSDYVTGVSEAFTYDGLNRIRRAEIPGVIVKTATYDTSGLGNIATKSDVGTYTYGGAGAGPHAVTSIVGTVNGVVNPSFTYDQNGNLISGAGRTITWTSFNMASLITQGTASVSLAYDSEHKRISQIMADGETRYLEDPSTGSMSERFLAAPGGTSTWRDYVSVEGRLVALRIISAQGNPVYRWMVTDHLGSVTVITNSAGTVLERLSYDAWGKRRNPDGTDPTTPITSAYTNRGFTGQEMMDAVGLINFNARMYDPLLGRFMSADPIVDDASSLQALNEYSYVVNNPLSFTDPSGMCFLGCFWKQSWFRPLLAIAAVITLQYYALPAIEGWGSWSAITALTAAPNLGILAFNAGIAGGVAGAISSGNLKGALLGAAQGFVTFGVTPGLGGDIGSLLGSKWIGNFIAQGLTGGLFSELGGGKFGSGFLAAGFTALASPVTLRMGFVAGTAMSSLIGGTASVLGGGKFANGALTGAFAYAALSLADYLASDRAWTGAPGSRPPPGTILVRPRIDFDHPFQTADEATVAAENAKEAAYKAAGGKWEFGAFVVLSQDRWYATYPATSQQPYGVYWVGLVEFFGHYDVLLYTHQHITYQGSFEFSRPDYDAFDLFTRLGHGFFRYFMLETGGSHYRLLNFRGSQRSCGRNPATLLAC